MSSMLKLLATTLLLSSVLGANQNAKIEKFLKESFSNNPALISIEVKVVERIPVESMKGWDAVIVSADGVVKAKGKEKTRKVKQKMIWFTNGKVVTKELTDMDTKQSLRDSINPTLKSHHYKKENLVYGNANAKHKVAIFSDPLCPFCSTFVPAAINYMKKYPNKFAVYYYHFPLPSLHPAAIELAQAAIAAELKGRKNVVLDMYKVEINPKERDVKKILAAFNKTMKTNITQYDISAPEVVNHFKSDLDIADDVMVQGTPTMFFDGEIDKTKRKYQKVK